MASTFSLQGKLGLDAKDFVSGAKKAENAVGDVADEMDELPASAKKSGGDAGSSLASGIKTAFAAAGVGAVVAAAFNDAMDAEAGVRRVQAQFALTAEQAERYGDLGSGLYASAWADSMPEATNAVAQVGVKLQDVGKIADHELSAITEQVLATSDVFGVDMDAVIRSVGNLLQNGLAPDAETAMDQVVAAFQSGGDEAGDLLDTIDEYSPHWAKLGIDGDEALGLIITGFQNGFRDGDKLADLIKEFGLRALEDEAVSAFDALGLAGEEMQTQFGEGGDVAREAFRQVVDGLRAVENPIERNRLGVELFGTQWEDLGPQALTVLEDIETGLGEVEGAASDMAETVSDSTAVAMEEMKRRVMTTLAEIAEDGLIPLADAAAGLSEGDFAGAIQGLRDFAWEYNVVGQTATTVLGAVQGALTKTAETTGTVGDMTGDMADEFGTAHDSAMFLESQTWALENATAEAGDTAESTGSDIAGLGDEADTTTSKLDEMTAEFDAMKASLSERSAFLTVIDGFQGMEQAGVEALHAHDQGFEDAGEKLRAYEQDQIRLKNEVIDYAEEVGNIPTDVVSEINTLIDEGNFAEAERRLSLFEEERTSTLTVTLHQVGQLKTPDGNWGALAGGTDNWRGGVALVGEQGPELVNLPKGSQVIPAAQTAAMFAQSVPAPRAITTHHVAQTPTGSPGVTINHYGPNLSAADVSRGLTMTRLAQAS